MSALLMYIASAWADVLHAAEDAAAVGLTRTMSELAVDAAAIVPKEMLNHIPFPLTHENDKKLA